MSLSLQEIRLNTERFVAMWEKRLQATGAAKVKEDSDYTDFCDDLLRALGLSDERLRRYQHKVKHLRTKSTKRIDMFWPGKLLVEVKSPHEDLDKAEKQALDYLPMIEPRRDVPEYLLVTDFRLFRLLRLDKGDLIGKVAERWHFGLNELPKKLDLFGFLTGYQRVSFADQPPVNRKAAELMADLHDELKAAGLEGHALEVFMVRLLFCLFADDTGLFRQIGVMRDYLDEKADKDGSITAPVLEQLFRVLDTPESSPQRNALHPLLKGLPYVNGALFTERLDLPAFTPKAHEMLLRACDFDWRLISPAVFGNLFQTIMARGVGSQRRQLGAEYTSEQNILKVINGLFMDDLRAELAAAGSSPSKLKALQVKLGSIKVLDPACGCGNFLILAYRELRLLELEIIKRLNTNAQGQLVTVTDVGLLTRVSIENFYGFEISEVPARIAEVAMHLVEHQVDTQLMRDLGQAFENLPLKRSVHITLGNALELDWANHVPANLTYIIGNPPFVGKHLMSANQTHEIAAVFSGLKGVGVLDYVSGWYGKAANLMQAHPTLRTAFVSTNSICQGEQVGVLWGYLLRQGFHIHFAHRTFAWQSEARGKAAVYCIVVAFGLEHPEKPMLYEYPDLKGQPQALVVKNISPYLAEGGNVVVEKRGTPLCVVPEMMFGSKPVDDGNLLFTEIEKSEFIKLEPKAEKFLKPINSAEEFINGKGRWCLWLKDASPSDLRAVPKVLERIEAVKKFRLSSTKLPTRDAAQRSHEFAEIRQPKEAYLLFPRVSSENRAYIPIGFFPSDFIVSDGCICLPQATPYHFGILTSAMHMAWVRTIAGRLKSDYRYSNQLCYNPYPWPETTTKQQEKITVLAEAVLAARASWPESTLADLYDPLTMPDNLRKAHAALDKAVDVLYKPEGFTTEAARVAHLLERYQQLTAPLTAAMAKPKRGKRDSDVSVEYKVLGSMRLKDFNALMGKPTSKKKTG